jgi:hypothetical protein
LTSAAALISYFRGEPCTGTVVVYSFWIVYLAIFKDGDFIGTGTQQMDMWVATSSYLGPILVWSVAGTMANIALHTVRFLSGEEIKTITKGGKYQVSGGIIAALWAWLLLYQIGTLVLIEINAPNFSFTLRGYLTVGLQLVGWFLLYMILRNQVEMFNSQDSRWGAWSIVIVNAPVYLIYGIVYVSFQIGTSEATWFGGLWASYCALISGGVAFAWFFVAYYIVRRSNESRPAKVVTSNSKAKTDYHTL